MIPEMLERDVMGGKYPSPVQIKCMLMKFHDSQKETGTCRSDSADSQRISSFSFGINCMPFHAEV